MTALSRERTWETTNDAWQVVAADSLDGVIASLRVSILISRFALVAVVAAGHCRSTVRSWTRRLGSALVSNGNVSRHGRTCRS